MSLSRSIREYLSAVVRAYTSFVLGIVFGVAGAIGLFVSDQSGVRIAALIGVALGFLVAPYQAFQRMRQERDAARANDQFAHLRFANRYVNWLSGSSWSIQGFLAPDVPGLVVRAITAAAYSLARDAEATSDLMERLRAAAAESGLERWLETSFADSRPRSPTWQLASPCNGFEITVQRDAIRHAGGGSEICVRAMLLLPRGIYGVLPRLLIDVIARDLPQEATAQPDIYRPFELAGTPWRPDLEELFQLLNVLADALVRDLAPVAFPPIIRRPRRERILVRLRGRDRLRLIGPNFNVRAKPQTLAQALQLPDFRQLAGGYDEAEIFVETPTHVSPFDRERRADLIRRAIKTFLRMQQYVHFENHVEGIGNAQSTPAPEPAGTPATPASR